MPPGIEVLEAAIAGKRVRCEVLDGNTWLRWDSDIQGFRSEQGTPWHFAVRDLFIYSWEIEGEPPMTFEQACDALDAGQLVERGEYRFRPHPTKPKAYQRGYWGFTTDDPTERWIYGTPGSEDAETWFTVEDFRATDWRIVAPEAKDDRLTLQEAGEWLATHGTEIQMANEAMQLTWALRPSAKEWANALENLAFCKPAMFRKEGEHA